jgi:predicted secreted hydrolase
MFSRQIFLGMVVLVGLLAGSAPADETGDFRAVTGPCHLRFPEDHGPHPGYRTEWWYYTGHLAADDGRRFGFQLTFFRRQLRPADAARDWPDPPSAWRTNQIYLAHAALTDLAGRQHLMAENVRRANLGLAGAVTDGPRTRVFLQDWEAVITPTAHTLHMTDPGFGLDLRLVPTKRPTPHGEDGYSRKGERPEQASCYYSFPRMAARGRVRIGATELAVAGLGWMDHEYSSAPLAEDIVGWDWFSIQLDDRRELMLYLLRRADHGWDPASSGSLVDPQGRVVHLARSDFEARVTRRWTSPATGATYPLGWVIRIPGQALELNLTAALDDQEMITTGSTGVTYWEGCLSVSATSAGSAVAGQGYMELTGYAEPYAPPL